jgi:glycerophosphoryl diester phosphodiesterase
MRIFRKIDLAALGLFVMLFSACVSNKSASINKAEFVVSKVVAHRGAWKNNNLPQNSIASLKQAIEMNCSGSEFDVRMTADDSLVINHDPHYNNLPVENTTYADLIKFNLSNGEKLPTLREYILAGIKNNQTTRLVCEIKPSEISKERGQLIAARVLQLVKEVKAQQMVDYISFDYEMLKKIVELNPMVSTQYLEGDKSPDKLKADGITGADYHFSVFKNNLVWIKSAKENNIILNAWTVNEATDLEWLIANGFDFITTDEPELLQQRIKVAFDSNANKSI